MRFLTHVVLSIAALTWNVAAQGFEDSSEGYHPLLLARDNYILARQDYLEARDLLEHALQARGRSGYNSAFNPPKHGQSGHDDNDAGRGSGRRVHTSESIGHIPAEHGPDNGGYGSGRAGYNSAFHPHSPSHPGSGGSDDRAAVRIGHSAPKKGYLEPAY